MKSKKSSSNPTLVLLDTHAILHRAYHAIPDFASSKGEPTGGLYGLSLMLIGIANELKPDYIVAAYDLPGPTYRHEAYKAYKAGRPKTDPALVAQIERSHDVIAAFNIPEYSAPGFEADDILGTIVEQMMCGKPPTATKDVRREGQKSFSGGLSEEKELVPDRKAHRQGNQAANVDIIIASGDMDTMQLIDDDRVRVYTLKKGIKDTVIYNEKGIIERYGFGPKLIPDYKGLRGDASDNIIGIAGIGEKTATDLIKNFGSVEDIYKILGKGEAGEKKLLAAGIKARIIELLKNGKEEADFSKMLATIRRDAPIEFKLPTKKWREDFDFSKIEKLFKELEFRTLGARVKAVIDGHVEGKGSKPKSAKVDTSFGGAPQAIQQNRVLDRRAEDGANFQQTNSRTRRKNVSARAPDEEGLLPVPLAEFRPIAVGAWLLDSNYGNPSYQEVLEITNAKDWEDAKKAVLEEITSRGLSRVYNEVELPLIPVLDAMKERGIKIDRKYLVGLSKEYNGKIKELEKGIYKLAGQEFNINSPKQLGDILFDKLQLTAPRMKKTAGGARSTKESELSETFRACHRKKDPRLPSVDETRWHVYRRHSAAFG